MSRLGTFWRDLRLGTKLAIVMAVVAMLPLILLTAINSAAMRAQLTLDVQAESLSHAHDVVLALETFLDGALADIRLIAVEPDTQDLLASPDTAPRDETAFFLHTALTEHGFDAVYLTELDGRVLLASDARLVGRSYASAPFVLAALAGQSAFDAPRYDPQDGQVYIHLSAPVHSPQGMLLGAVVGRLALQSIDQCLAPYSQFEWPGAVGVLWDEVGVQLSPDTPFGKRMQSLAPLLPESAAQIRSEARWGPSTAVMLQQSGHLDAVVQQSRALRAGSGEPHVRVHTAQAGVMQVAIEPLHNVPWTYGIFVPESALLAVVNVQTRVMLGATLVATLLAVACSVVVARVFTRSIREITKAAQALAAGDMGQRTALRRQDELGQLGATFDKMADALAEKERQLRGYAEELERKVEQRTRALRTSEKELRLLYEAGQRLSKSVDLEVLYQTLYDLLTQIIEADAIFVSSYSADDGMIRCTVAWDQGERLDVSGFSPTPLEPEGQGTQSVAIRSGQALLLNDYEGQRRTAQTSYLLGKGGTLLEDPPADAERPCSALIVPLKLQEQVVGVLQVFSRHLNAYTPDHLRILEALALHLASALNNATLYQQAQNEIAERKRVEEKLKQTRVLVEHSPAVLFRWRAEPGRPVDFVSENVTLFGYTPAEILSGQVRYTAMIHPDDLRRVTEEMNAYMESGDEAFRQEYRLVTPDGDVRWIEDHTQVVHAPDGRVTHHQGVVIDITEQRHLEEQLRQSQKMESVGRLAGGIAHDFNNLLTAIIGFAGLACERLPMGDASRGDLEQVLRAAERAAALTRQMLAFSRRQILSPRVLNLNDLILDMEKILHRIIGEDIRFVTQTAPDLGLVKADPSHIEQVLVNLVVNARDAMPTGGTLTVSASNATLDEEWAQKHTEATPGDYVLLTVSDTGVGMSSEVQSHLFEPFFTTKEVGQGTGLGLATVYGIVKQHHGHIWVYSEPGMGSTFKVFLPRAEAGPAAVRWRDESGYLPGGDETILVVEDEPSVRALTERVLEGLGYRVLGAGDGAEALRVATAWPNPIQLLITDVVMPGMNGKRLADEFKALRPELKVLYVSGYTDEVLAQRDVVAAGVAFLQKPFRAAVLARKVREVLG